MDSHGNQFARATTNTVPMSVGFDRMIVAFSRPRNIRDSIMRSRLPDVEGSHPSEILNKLYDTGVIQRNLFEV
jgi:hypothetical protein